jgi:rhodanese-related sulfurtransferase
MKSIQIIIFGFLLLVSGILCFDAKMMQSAEARSRAATSTATEGIPESKQTNLGLYVSAREAFAKWEATPDAIIILDVRTPEEFLFVGHATMAWNVPAFVQSYAWDAERGRFPMRPNPDFVLQVRSIAEPSDTLLVMCRSGSRSARAVDSLAAAGFENVYNIIDGMEGDMVRDPESVFRGQRLKNGWKNSGLPWTYDIDPNRMLMPQVE